MRTDRITAAVTAAVLVLGATACEDDDTEMEETEEMDGGDDMDEDMEGGDG